MESGQDNFVLFLGLKGLKYWKSEYLSNLFFCFFYEQLLIELHVLII